MPDPPDVDRITCVSTAAAPCPQTKALVRGGRLRLKGSNLDRTRTLVFLGRRGRSDDMRVRPRTVKSSRVDAAVPSRARSGPLLVLTDDGHRVRSRPRVRIVRAAPVDIAPGAAFFLDGKRKPSATFTVTHPQTLTIELVRVDDDRVLQTWNVSATPAEPARVEWDGHLEGAGAPSGRYRFRLAGGEAGATASSAGAFAFYDHLFPIRGRHDLGQTETNNFGGGRRHQGQDMFAKCGTRIAAARGGTVQYAGYHSRAGNYVVIDGKDTGVDYVYMHMRDTPLVRTGDKAATGRQLGRVGDTGRATGCHLHFEMWSSPGWYDGGAAFDPLPQLRKWDAYS